MRTEPTQDRSRQTVQAILDAANAEFAEHGYHGARITRIARRAKVSPGSLYRFFPDKDALGAAVANSYVEAVMHRYRAVADGFRTLDDVPWLLKQLLDMACELQLEFPGFYRLTNDVSPVHEHWVGHGVRSLLVEALTVLLTERGITTADGNPELGVVIEFVIETGRSRLATIPIDPDIRTPLLDELLAMLTLYATDRLRSTELASADPPRSLSGI